MRSGVLLVVCLAAFPVFSMNGLKRVLKRPHLKTHFTPHKYPPPVRGLFTIAHLGVLWHHQLGQKGKLPVKPKPLDEKPYRLAYDYCKGILNGHFPYPLSWSERQELFLMCYDAVIKERFKGHRD